MPANISQWTATGSYSDLSTQDITNTAAWAVSDTSIVTVGAANGQVTIQAAGKIWGADVGITATLAPGTPGTGTILCIASDSGSRAPRMPQQDNHWVALGLSPWGSWWGFQEASGSDTLIGSGSAGFSLTRVDGAGGDGTGLHQNVDFDGWLRKGITISGSTAQRLQATSGNGPNPGSTSVGWLAYARVDSNGQSPASGRVLGMTPLSAPNQSGIILVNAVGANGSLRFFSQLGNKTMVGPNTHQHSDRFHPILFIYNKTTAEAWAFTDEVLCFSSSHAVIADDTKGFGARAGTTPASCSFVWGAMATGSIVERLCDPSASADFLSRLGWNVSWKTCPTDSGSIKCPFLDMHWKELGLQTWTATWNMQGTTAEGLQSSFDRWEKYNTEGWSLSQGGTPQEETVVPHWTRKSVQFVQTANHRLLQLNDANMQWDPTGSQAYLIYVSASQGTGGRAIYGYHAGNSTFQAASLNIMLPLGSAAPAIYCAGETTTGSVSVTNDRVHPMLLVYDKTNSRVKLYTDLEKITGSFNALSLITSLTGNLTIGGTSGAPGGGFTTPPPMQVVYASFCTGALAESLSDDGKASDLLKKLGWTSYVSW